MTTAKAATTNELIVCSNVSWPKMHFRPEYHVARGEAGDRERARELLLEVQTGFEEMGLSRYAAVARERLEELGVAKEAAI